MANWLMVKVNMQKVSDMEAREKMKEEMGIDLDIESEDIWRPVVIDLDRVTTYTAMYDEDAELVPGKSSVTMENGEFITLEIDFDDLDKLLRLKSSTKKK